MKPELQFVYVKSNVMSHDDKSHFCLFDVTFPGDL